MMIIVPGIHVSELNQAKLQQYLEIIIYKGHYSTDSFCIWSDIAMRIPLMIIFQQEQSKWWSVLEMK
jgi:hypothetical protein